MRSIGTQCHSTHTAGPDDEGTLTAENHLVNALLDMGEHADAEALGRETLEKRRSILGRDHRKTLLSPGTRYAGGWPFLKCF